MRYQASRFPSTLSRTATHSLSLLQPRGDPREQFLVTKRAGCGHVRGPFARECLFHFLLNNLQDAKVKWFPDTEPRRRCDKVVSRVSLSGHHLKVSREHGSCTDLVLLEHEYSPRLASLGELPSGTSEAPGFPAVVDRYPIRKCPNSPSATTNTAEVCDAY